MEALIHGLWIIGGIGIFATFGTYFARKIMCRHVEEGHNDVLISLFITAGRSMPCCLASLWLPDGMPIMPLPTILWRK